MNASSFDKFEDRPCFATRGATFILYEILHSEIVKQDMVPFLEFWNIDRIARAGRLHHMFGKIMFSVSGYDNDPRPLYEILEVRQFLKKLAREWPYFFYAQFLGDAFLTILLKCMIPTLTSISTDSNPAASRLKISHVEFDEAYGKLYDGLLKICSMDKTISQTKFDERDQAVRAHLNEHFPSL